MRAQLLPGHEALIETLAADSSTTGVQAAAAVLAAERNLRQAHASAQAAATLSLWPKCPAGRCPLPATRHCSCRRWRQQRCRCPGRAQAAWDGSANLRAGCRPVQHHLAYARPRPLAKSRTSESRE